MSVTRSTTRLAVPSFRIPVSSAPLDLNLRMLRRLQPLWIPLLASLIAGPLCDAPLRNAQLLLNCSGLGNRSSPGPWLSLPTVRSVLPIQVRTTAVSARGPLLGRGAQRCPRSCPRAPGSRGRDFGRDRCSAHIARHYPLFPTGPPTYSRVVKPTSPSAAHSFSQYNHCAGVPRVNPGIPEGVNQRNGRTKSGGGGPAPPMDTFPTIWALIVLSGARVVIALFRDHWLTAPRAAKTRRLSDVAHAHHRGHWTHDSCGRQQPRKFITSWIRLGRHPPARFRPLRGAY